jgi:hypothetical protein
MRIAERKTGDTGRMKAMSDKTPVGAALAANDEGCGIKAEDRIQKPGVRNDRAFRKADCGGKTGDRI